MNLFTNPREIDASTKRSKFPNGAIVLAFIENAKHSEDEFSEVASPDQIKDISNWYLSGIGLNSTGTYYVMDFVRVFVNIDTGECILVNDYNIDTGGLAFQPSRAEDCYFEDIEDYSDLISSDLKDLLCVQ